MTKHSSAPALLVWASLSIATLLLLGAGTPVANAEDPKTAEELKTLLVEGERPADWNSVLWLLQGEARDSHATRYGAVVGPIFTTESLTDELGADRKQHLFAHVIAHLLQEEPEGDVVLLVDVFVPHLVADPGLAPRLRESLTLDLSTGRLTGWDRLMRSVVRMVGTANGAARRAAIRCLPLGEPPEVPNAVATLYAALLANGGKTSRDDATAILDAFERLMQHRCDDVKALESFLDRFGERLTKSAEWTPLERARLHWEMRREVQLLAKSEDSRHTERRRKVAREYGRALIRKAQDPGDLKLFFDPDLEADAVLQREAAQKATTLKPVANEAWADLMRRCLAHSTDDLVLESIIKILGKTFVKPAPPHTQVVATAVAKRLKEGAKTDAVSLRVVLAQVLGAIGNVTDLQEALPEPRRLLNGNGDASQAPVWAALIHAVGLVESGSVLQLALYYRHEGKLQPEWARLAVAKALGLNGIRNSETERPRAAAMLRHILTGAEITIGERIFGAQTREAASPVCIAAISSMEHYPDLGTATVLGDIAEQQTEVGAVAVKSLGRQMRQGSVAAGNEIAELITNEVDATRLTVLLDLVTKETPDSFDAGARASLAKAVRGVLQREDVGDAQRLKAAEASVRLADALALRAVYDNWVAQTDEAARAQWKQLLHKLLVAVAPLGADNPSVEKALLELLGVMRGQKLHAEALACLDAIGESANRLELKRTRADLHFEYASTTDGRTPAERRADLDAAERLYKEVASGTKDDAVKRDSLINAYEVLKLRVQDPYLDTAGGELAKTFQLRALDVAVQSGDPATAKEANESIVRVLEQGTAGLTDEEKAELEKRKTALAEIANG